MMKKDEHLSTKLMHTGTDKFSRKVQQGVSAPEIMPIYLSSVFSFEDVPTLDSIYEGKGEGYIYTRNGNPSLDATEEILAAAEGADGAVVFASGMSAITTAIIACVQGGDHIVASPVLYGETYEFLLKELPRFGVTCTMVDVNDKEALEKAIQPNTKLIYTETISNPTMEVADIPMIAEIAHAHGCTLMVDNTFASPVVARPIELGADIVVYSATKYLNGHSDITGGVVLSDAETIKRIEYYFTLYGGVMGPFSAYLLSRSMRTLEMRVTRHSENAMKVAKFLEGHPNVEKVFYPGLDSSPSKEVADKVLIDGNYGGMLSAIIKGGEAGASALIANTTNIKFAPSLACTQTTISYPSKTSHRGYSEEDRLAAGITMGMLRFSIGLENPDDIISELGDALDRI